MYMQSAAETMARNTPPTNDTPGTIPWQRAARSGGPLPRKQLLQSGPAGQDQGTVFDAFLHSKAFQDMIRAAVQEALRSPEGQDILTQAVRKELARQR